MTQTNAWKQHFAAGMEYGQAADLENAEASFRAAIEIAPDEPHPVRVVV